MVSPNHREVCTSSLHCNVYHQPFCGFIAVALKKGKSEFSPLQKFCLLLVEPFCQASSSPTELLKATEAIVLSIHTGCITHCFETTAIGLSQGVSLECNEVLQLFSLSLSLFFSFPQVVSVERDSEGFYQLRSTLMLQETYQTHRTFLCACLIPFLGNETRNISSEKILISFGEFLIVMAP